MRVGLTLVPAYGAHRTASAIIAIAAIHEPATRSATAWRQRAVTDAAHAITISEVTPPHHVPISIATGAPSKTGAVTPDAVVRPHKTAPASNTSLADVSPTPHASAPRPMARPNA